MSWEYIAEGNEGKLYRYKGKYAFKIYKSHVQWHKKKREFDFLNKYSGTGATPTLYSNLDDLRQLDVIVMEYLDGYQTLKRFILDNVKKTKTKKQLNNLIIALAKARYLVGPDSKYEDLHASNVMIKFNGDKVSVKLYDPGETNTHKGTPYWTAWVYEMVKDLGLVRTPAGSIIKKQRGKDIRKLWE